ncbi:galactosyl transferase gma12 mnn10 family protein [Cercophora scortea]|uniref:Galactosyl transferase gma12 mnn10 family protein n=1 Tax=Cercophora scortea TaxID=314031 RepID=A0AAE0J4E6_9PEZI|nr:galactosyl transferase gma12 mnn10 family protein [Cercophora scortea]
MILHSLYLQRPARLFSALALLVFACILLANVRDSGLSNGLLPAHRRPGKPTALTSRVAKVTVAANALNISVIHRALQTHERHNQRHGYLHHIALNEAVSGLIENDRQHRPKGAWTKPAYLLSILVAELQKPQDQRLKWVFWFDADTAILNPHTPLEIFLPPENATGLENVDLIINSNWDGLNSGVFALRVSPWSVTFLSAVLAYPIYEAKRLQTDRFRDQSAFQFLLQGKDSPFADTPMKGKDHWVEVPMRWFNSLPVNNAFFKNGTWIFGKNMTEAQFDNGTTVLFDDGHDGKVNPWKVMQGDMVVHFAGTSYFRDSWMGPWIARAEAELPEWSNATTKWALMPQIRDFWDEVNEKMVVDRAKSAIEEAEKKRLREKLAKEKKEKEEKDKLEKARLAKEKKEQEEKDKLEKARLEKEKKEKDEKDKQEKARLEKEKMEKDRADKEKAEADKQAQREKEDKEKAMELVKEQAKAKAPVDQTQGTQGSEQSFTTESSTSTGSLDTSNSAAKSSDDDKTEAAAVAGDQIFGQVPAPAI